MLNKKGSREPFSRNENGKHLFRIITKTCRLDFEMIDNIHTVAVVLLRQFSLIIWNVKV